MSKYNDVATVLTVIVSIIAAIFFELGLMIGAATAFRYLTPLVGDWWAATLWVVLAVAVIPLSIVIPLLAACVGYAVWLALHLVQPL